MGGVCHGLPHPSPISFIAGFFEGRICFLLIRHHHLVHRKGRSGGVVERCAKRSCASMASRKAENEGCFWKSRAPLCHFLFILWKQVFCPSPQWSSSWRVYSNGGRWYQKQQQHATPQCTGTSGPTLDPEQPSRRVHHVQLQLNYVENNDRRSVCQRNVATDWRRNRRLICRDRESQSQRSRNEAADWADVIIIFYLLTLLERKGINRVSKVGRGDWKGMHAE